MTLIKKESLWNSTEVLPKFSELEENLITDVCIIGAGISGLCTAYLLSKAGKKVVVLDKGRVGGGETGWTTAHLTYVLDNRYFELEKLQGKKKAKLALKSHKQAIDLIEKIIKDEGMEVDFKRVDGYLFFGENEKKELEKELEVITKLGGEVEVVNEVGGRENLGKALKFSNQGQFHPLKFLDGLIKAILKNGGEIYENSLVNEVKEKEQNVEIELANEREITAAQAIVMTNSPFNNRFKIHTKQAPYQTYAIGVSLKNKVAEGLYWDTEDPYHYIRIYDGGNEQFLIVGGEDHKTGQEEHTEDKYEKLWKWTKENFPEAGKVEYQWSGQVFETIDGLAYIGANPGDKRTFIGTGYSGNGMTYGVIAAQMIEELIAGKACDWKEIYDPGRKNLMGVGNFAEENLNVASQYLDLLKPEAKVNLEKLEKGEGTVINEGMKKVAIYKDKTGKICKYSAICTHLGCVVKWNKAETTWDCPCHGSRFDAHGKVMNGPATADLPKEE